MDISWRNPFSGTQEPIYVPDSTVESSGAWRVPSAFRTLTLRWKVVAGSSQGLQEKKEYRSGFGDLEEKAIDGLIAHSNQGDFDSRYRLMLLLINVLELPDNYINRRLQNKVAKKTIKQVTSFLSAPGPTLYIELWKEVERLLLGERPAAKPLELRKADIEELQTDMINAYKGTFPEEGQVQDNHLRNFRERVKRSPAWSALPAETKATLRHEAAIYHCFFFEKIALAFLNEAESHYSKAERYLFRLLHLSLSAPTGYKGLLKRLPPISSLDIYPIIREAYNAAFGKDPCGELLGILEQKKPEEMSAFLGRILGVLQWYRKFYLTVAREEDIRRDPLHANADVSTVSPAIIPIQKLLTQSQEVWMKKFKALPFTSPADLRNAIQQDPSPQRRKILLDLLQAKTPSQIADELCVSRQAVEQRAKTGLKRLQKIS